MEGDDSYGYAAALGAFVLGLVCYSMITNSARDIKVEEKAHYARLRERVSEYKQEARKLNASNLELIGKEE